jgi:multidrug efflux system membrane fusion protein
MKRAFSLILFYLAALTAQAIEFGYTEPSRIAQAAFAETGVIASINVTEGAKVTTGQVLAWLNADTLRQDLGIAQEQLRLQSLRYDQINGLHQAGNVSMEENEKAKSDLAVADLRVKRILAQLDDRSLRAPFDGVVTKINREVTESVSAAQTEVMTLVQLDSLKVTLHLPEKIAGPLALQDAVWLVLEDKIPVTGRVEFISPVVDAASHTIRVTFRIANPEGKLRSGVRCVLASEAAPAASGSAGEEPAGAETTVRAGRTAIPVDETPLPLRRPRAAGGRVDEELNGK